MVLAISNNIESEYKRIPNTDYELSEDGLLRHYQTKSVLPKKIKYGFSKDGKKYTIFVEKEVRLLFHQDSDIVWKKWPRNFEYEISRCGMIRNLHKRIIKPQIKDGYLYIALNIDSGKKYKTGVHQIVAQTYLSPPAESSYSVNHINNLKTDNRVENLEWSSQSEQVKQAWLNEGRKKRYIIVIHDNGTIEEYESAKLAAEAYNVKYKTMLERVKRHTKVNGILFEWKDEMYDATVIEGERWKRYEINGIATSHQISDHGRVASSLGILKLNDNFKYHQVTVHIPNDKSYSRQIHIMVAEMFLKKPDTTPYSHSVDHLNKDVRNNRVTNLEWVTVKEQNRRASAKPVIKYNLNEDIVDIFETMTLAAASINYISTKFKKSIVANEIIQGHIWKQFDNTEYPKIKNLIDQRHSSKSANTCI